MKNRFTKESMGIMVLTAVLACASVCESAVYVEEWESDDAAWSIKSKDEGVAYGSESWFTGSAWDGQEEILRIEASTGVGVFQDIIYANDAADGTLTEDGHFTWQPIQFDFYANMAPTKLYAYVKGDGVLWQNEITSVTVGTWDSYEIGLGYDDADGWNRWDGTGSTLSDWQSSVADMDEVGIMIWYQSNIAGQEYGLDNFTIIPEPGTWLMIGFALLSVAYTFRRQIEETLARVKSRII